MGVIPLFIGAQEHVEDEYLPAREIYHQRVAELGRIGVNLVHPEGSSPFTIRGYAAEKELVKGWENKYGVTVVTTGMSHAEELREAPVIFSERGGAANETLQLAVD